MVIYFTVIVVHNVIRICFHQWSKSRDCTQCLFSKTCLHIVGLTARPIRCNSPSRCNAAMLSMSVSHKKVDVVTYFILTETAGIKCLENKLTFLTQCCMHSIL